MARQLRSGSSRRGPGRVENPTPSCPGGRWKWSAFYAIAELLEFPDLRAARRVEKPSKYSLCETTACALDVGRVANLRGGWLPPQ